ncbi:MAG: hypothetical protein H0Z34_05460 [Brevibacillus sp.]|nr:hypothetical protein [Brevibacillus sp.]
MYGTKSRQAVRDSGMVVRPHRFAKMLEVAVAATILWAFLRAISRFFHFTPYGNGVFSRPFMGMGEEGTRTGVVLGVIVLFVLILLATVLYGILFSRFQQWWGGVLYGGALFLLFGQFLQMWRWNANTLSTELAWFLSLGLFIGISLTAERYDQI